MLPDSQSLEPVLSLGWTDPHNPLLAMLAVPVLGLAANVVSQIFLLRLAGGKAFLKSIALGFLLGGALTLAAYLMWVCLLLDAGGQKSFIDWFFLIAPTYAGLGYGYANFANLGNSSIRIRLYEEVRQATGGLPVDEIRRRYNESAILKARLLRLQESGDLIRAGLSWVAARKRFVFLGGAIFFAKQLILQKKSEFDPTSSPQPR